MDCNNFRKYSPDQVEDHLYANGMAKDYTKWTDHGENDDDFELEDDILESENEEDVDDVVEMLNDFQAHDDRESQEHVPIMEENKFRRLMRDAEQELYPALLELVKEALPDGNTCPRSHYESKKIIRDLGLSYDKIHACKNDCVLFWEEYEDKLECPICQEPRYSFDNGKKKIPQKILRYFPLTPRLQRLFISKKTAVDMKWHKDKRPDDEYMRHPADSQVWKDFDLKHESFAMDSRNVRLGLSTDGFNPFGNLSTSYSMWPVFLVPYNLPPWKCMKDPYFMMSLLIPGPRAPGNDIDVFLQPLIKELKQLWEVGVDTYDAGSGHNFRLRAALLWTINDFPAYANLSGWSTKGKMACPTCNDQRPHQWLNSWQKTIYYDHRRFLPQNHRFRKNLEFNSKVEKRLKPALLSGDDVVCQLTHVSQPCFGKGKKRKRCADHLNWTKRSIFFDLPYWHTLKLRHNLDVMHIEKNICDNILGTLMDTEGKTKDSYKTRLDMEEMGIKSDLHPKCIDGVIKFRPAYYTFNIDERKGFCEFCSCTKLPDGMASNISNCVNIADSKIYGLKSHDCHIILQRLLPVALRGYLSKDVREVIIKLCLFFKELTSKTLRLDVLERLDKDIVVLLCKLELNFPPSFFNIMTHLPIHLAYEAILAGPVQYRWMFPFERIIAETKPTLKDQLRKVIVIVNACILLHNVKLLKGAVDDVLSLTDFARIRWEHKAELERQNIPNIEKEQQQKFHKWFLRRVQQMQVEGSTEDVESLLYLASGPQREVARYSGCIINGIRFHTQKRDANKKTQNYGVVVKGEHRGKSIDFYGVLKDIIVLSYLGNNQVIVFKCDWPDLNARRGIQVDENQFTSVNFTKKWYMNDPFALACQTQQVYYLKDTKHGSNWRVVERSQPRGMYDFTEKETEVGDSLEEVEDPYQQESHGYVDSVEVDVGETSLHRDDMDMIVVDLNAKDSDAEDGDFNDEDNELMSYDDIEDDST
ncbi:uncharacterized protein LOC112199281 [Rosa chinensis]|uniref:uncharacterized protein LOC112199281 n=1 Tax=Rosa chinensis TaxID=74649 RepID=UPI000D08D852|nr:uncharacterized protein LOC112199281 [Rosa chinensis]